MCGNLDVLMSFIIIILARFKKEYEGLTKKAPPFNLFIYMY